MAAVQSPQGLKTGVSGVEVMEHTPAVAELFTRSTDAIYTNTQYTHTHTHTLLAVWSETKFLSLLWWATCCRVHIFKESPCVLTSYSSLWCLPFISHLLVPQIVTVKLNMFLATFGRWPIQISWHDFKQNTTPLRIPALLPSRLPSLAHEKQIKLMNWWACCLCKLRVRLCGQIK